MRRVWLYTSLLLGGLGGSQVVPGLLPAEATGIYETAVRLLTMAGLSFIMIHVGYEFEIDKENLRSYGWDYVVAATAATFPWILCTFYFVYVMSPPDTWGQWATWRDSLLSARFTSPTSAGVLFSMLAAAGLSATWVFRKARTLAIFDDLDTVLLMIPLKMMMVGIKWQLGVVILFMGALLYMAWKYLHAARIPIRWPWVMFYAAVITTGSELVYHGSKILEDTVPIHLEVLLPAFVLGCVMARPEGHDPHVDDGREGHQEGPESPEEQRVSSIVSAIFMVLVGLSMPSLSAISQGGEPLPGTGVIALHVVAITLLSNIGKMFPAFCYRKEAHRRERLATAIAMFPRGEVGAGILVVSLSYGIGGFPIAVALFSLALNLVLTGPIISVVLRLLSGVPKAPNPSSRKYP